MRVLLVTSDRDHCGVREYGRMLQAELEKLGVEVEEFPDPDYAHLPLVAWPRINPPDIVHVNHHAALHSSWTKERVDALVGAGVKVVVTQHDTYETWDIMQERGFQDFRGASALVTHELVEGLPYGYARWTASETVPAGQSIVVMIPQGVPALPAGDHKTAAAIQHGRGREVRPTLGMFGFDFPWKNFDLGVRLAREAGWDVLLIAAGMSEERRNELSALHDGGLSVFFDYLPGDQVVSILASCDATAFLYQNGNSATSAAIRTGIAARRPVVALKCRQFRDLYSHQGVWWCDGEEDLLDFLEMVKDPAIAKVQSNLVGKLAEEQSWARVAARYKEVYDAVLAAG